MSRKIVIVHPGFTYDGSTTQRLLGYAKAFHSFGYEVIMIVSLQSPLPVGFDWIRFVVAQTEFDPHSFTHEWNFLKATKRECGRDDILFLQGFPFFCWLLPIKKYNAFAEVTEIPFFGSKPTKLQIIGHRIRLSLAKRLKGMTAISLALKEYYKSQGIESVSVINMFVDSSRYDNITKQSVEPYIAYCGKVSLYKDGVDTLIKAFSIFHKSYPEYKLMIYGYFESESTKDRIYKLINELNLSNSVVCPGSLSPEDLAQALANASILALARPNNEQAKYGFPTKLGDYLSTGNPVVVTKVGEIPDFLADKENAILSEPDSETDFAEKLIWVASHPTESLRIGLAGKELVSTEFSSLVQSKKTLDFFLSKIK